MGLPPRPTAARTHGSLVALGLCAGLEREGVDPGRNFALIGNGDVAETTPTDPSRSVAPIACPDMGAVAAEALTAGIGSRDASPRRVVLESEALVRGTCNVGAPGEL